VLRDAGRVVGRKQGLLEREREGSVTVLDVRPSEDHAAGHVRGAAGDGAPQRRGVTRKMCQR